MSIKINSDYLQYYIPIKVRFISHYYESQSEEGLTEDWRISSKSITLDVCRIDF